MKRALWAVKLLAGLAALYIAFRDVDLDELWRAVGLVHGGWIALAVVSVAATVYCVMVRWRVLLDRPVDAAGRRVLTSAIIVSHVANIVMPFKLGDAFRIAAVSRALRVPPAQVLASVAAERFFDAALVGVIASALLLGGALPEFARRGLVALVVTLAGAAAVGLLVVWWRDRPVRLFARVAALVPAGLRARVASQWALLRQGLVRASRPRVAAAALVASCGVAAFSILTPVLVLRAFDIDAGVLAAAVLVIVLQIGNAVLPVPGAIGVAQVLTVATLALWGVDETPALAFAVVLYLVSRLPKIVVLPLALSALSAPPMEPA